MDETTVQVLSEPDKSVGSRSYMWFQCGDPPTERVVLFDFHSVGYK
ncbi:MAG: IS66 family transposase [Magnetococcus sp. YQC-9]